VAVPIVRRSGRPIHFSGGGPAASGARNRDERFVKQRFDCQIIFQKGPRHSSDQEVDLTVAQLWNCIIAMFAYTTLQADTRILVGKSLDDRRIRPVMAISGLPMRRTPASGFERNSICLRPSRISSKTVVPHLSTRLPVRRQHDALRRAIEQRTASVCSRSKSSFETTGCEIASCEAAFVMLPAIGHSHHDVQVAQPDAAANAISPIHHFSLS